jgi:hypothetical protein
VRRTAEASGFEEEEEVGNKGVVEERP